MNYMDLFSALSNAVILFIGSAAIIAFGTLVFGLLAWLYLWIGKHLVRYIHKVGEEFKECFTAPQIPVAKNLSRAAK